MSKKDCPVNEKPARRAVKEILLRQIPGNERSKWDKRMPSKEELEVKYRLVKR